MKKIFFIACFMVVGLLLQVGLGFAHRDPKEFAEQGASILKRIEREQGNPEAHTWKPSGPTVEDIQAATKVENLAVKGSREDKLISAVKIGDFKKVKTFIAAGAGLEARDNENMTALMRAAENGYSDIVSILLDAGADISAQDKFGFTAFCKAADKNHVDVVKILITKGAATDSTFEDVFVSSVSKGNTEMVKALMVESARIKHDTLNTAHMMALNRRRNNPELFNLVVEARNKKSQ
jgi:ankyrin repeat protein